ncbi:hypothetical protein HPB52_013175 [Rhipicephalus sanguineus]|uniref:Uncharacterized protein n=1 Tax=Rhipicephalus sanguineus TaxID=34632 RepID=A0A9D4PLJ5_RHISA|nr:hypothetical protein HPB52_013175 [Rhipicephalus sanguineus]
MLLRASDEVAVTRDSPLGGQRERMPATSALANAKPLWDSAPPPTLPATPAVIVEVAIEGHTITAEEFQADHWTPAANPNARNAAQDAAAATGSGTTPARLPPATKETRITVKSSKQLPPLPTNAIRVVAVQAELQITLPDDFCLRIHPTNNTFTAATTHSSTAQILKTLTSLHIGDYTCPCAAYVAAPPGATRGDETPTQLYQDLVRRNPEHTILAARRMGKTHSILITFDANEVPHSGKYMGAIHRCTPYRGSPDACTSCRQPGHRYDVCPNPKSNLFPRCGTQHVPQEPPCTPKCILCEGSHLTGTGSCKGRNLHRPRKQIKQPQTQQQEPVAHGDSFPQLSPGPTQPSQNKQAWTGPLNRLEPFPLFLQARIILDSASHSTRRPGEVSGGGSGGQSRSSSSPSRSRRPSRTHREARGQDKYSCHKLSKSTYPRSN